MAYKEVREQKLILWIAAFCLATFALAYIFPLNPSHADIHITATVNGICGNGILEPGEQCEGADLGGRSCSSFNFTSGTLGCTPLCSYDISQCTTYVPPPINGGGGGGGGSGAPNTNSSATAVFSGVAFPGSTVTLLKDSITAGSTVAGPDAKFQISQNGLMLGTYSFSLIAKDKNSITSNTQSFTVSLTSGVTTSITGIFFPPTISTDKEQVKQGDPLILFGQTMPKAQVNLAVHSGNSIVATTSADDKGVYFYQIDTTFLAKGSHDASSRSVISGTVSPISSLIDFIVGTTNKERTISNKGSSYNIADVNHDGKVDIIDFSILAYWYKRSTPPAAYDLNGDGKVDLIDLSIMAYNWTG